MRLVGPGRTATAVAGDARPNCFSVISRTYTMRKLSQLLLIACLEAIAASPTLPGGALAWADGPQRLVKLERAAGMLLIRAMGIGEEERSRAAAVKAGARRRNAKMVDFVDPQDEMQFGRVVRLSRQVAMLFLGHAVVQAVSTCREALHTRSPVVLTELGGCVDELWYAYFVLGSSAAFEAIAQDEGSDHDNLMSAIEKLARLWSKFRLPMLIKTLLTLLQPLLEPVLAPRLHELGEALRSSLAATLPGPWASLGQTS